MSCSERFCDQGKDLIVAIQSCPDLPCAIWGVRKIHSISGGREFGVLTHRASGGKEISTVDRENGKLGDGKSGYNHSGKTLWFSTNKEQNNY